MTPSVARATTAVAIQDASNFVAVINELHRMVEFSRQSGVPAWNIASDPAIRAVLYKAADMCGMMDLSADGYSALQECERLVAGGG